MRILIGSEGGKRYAVENIVSLDLEKKKYIVTITEETRTLEQNSKLHAMLGDIAKQVIYKGMKFNITIWKRLLTAAFLREKKRSPILIPAIDGEGIDIIYEETSKMPVGLMAEFIEYVYCYGAENNVKFKTQREEFSDENV